MYNMLGLHHVRNSSCRGHNLQSRFISSTRAVTACLLTVRAPDHHVRLCTVQVPQQRHSARIRSLQANPSSTTSTSPRLQQVLDGIDALNSQDSRQTTWQGKTLPYELAYSQWLTDWVLQLEPQPSEELRIVARGQHVERWKSPRSDFPEVRLLV